MFYDLKCATKYTYDTIYTKFQGITNNICGFGLLEDFFAPSFFTHPSPVHPYFYLSIFVLPVQMAGGGSLHEAKCSSDFVSSRNIITVTGVEIVVVR